MDRNKKAEMIECACGCGGRRLKYDIYGKERKYIQYHACIGRNISEEERKMRSESAKKKGMGKWMKQVWAEGRASPNSLKAIASKDRSYLIGKPLSAEHRKKLSNSRRRGLENGSIKIWNKGMKDPFPISEATRKKISIANTGSKRNDKTKKKLSIAKMGNKNPAWIGGHTVKYDEKFNRTFKKLIRKRDNQICMLCNKHREKLSRALHVHHINYNKELTMPQNSISLCTSCHTKTNHNRTHWIKFFQSLLSEKYNYDYSENSMMIINIGEPLRNGI